MPQVAIDRDLNDLYRALSLVNQDRENVGEMAFARARRAYEKLSQKSWASSIASAVYGSIARDRDIAVPALDALVNERTPFDSSDERAMFRCSLASICHLMMLNSLALRHLDIAYSYLKDSPNIAALDQVAYLSTSCGNLEFAEEVIDFSEKAFPGFSGRENVDKSLRVISAVRESGVSFDDARVVYSQLSDLIWKYLDKRPNINGLIDFQINSDEARDIPLAIISIGLSDDERFALDDELLEFKLSDNYPDDFLGSFGILVTSQNLYKAKIAA